MVFVRGVISLLTIRVTSVASLGVSLQEVRKKELSSEQWDFHDFKDKVSSVIGKVSSGVKERFVRSGQNSKEEALGSVVPEIPLFGPTTEVDQYDNSKGFAEWDLCDVKVDSNLGGKGPDTDKPPELRYYGVTTAVGAGLLDLIVTAKSPYSSPNVTSNGILKCFGIINVADGENGVDSVDLEFTFVKTGTYDPVQFSLFYFTIYDMDKSHSATEAVTFYKDVSHVYHEDDCEYTYTGDPSDPAGETFTATKFGTGDDNPEFPGKLTEQQRKKSLTISYENVATWTTTFSVSGGTAGRNFMFAGESPPTETGKDMCRVKGDCVIWGDPHILTFDAHQKLATKYPDREEFFQIRNRKADEVSVHEEGTFWIVKSKDVHIQGRYDKRPAHKWLGKSIDDRTVLSEMAVGGPFLKGNTLVLRPLVGNVTWNGKAILPKIGSDFSNKFISAKYHTGAEIVKDGSKGVGIEVALPGDMKLIVNRFTRGLAVKISMCGRHKQDGHCGNFNGDIKDDVQEILMARVGHRLHDHQILPWKDHEEKPEKSTKSVKDHKIHGKRKLRL